jgi:hypothetical protein
VVCRRLDRQRCCEHSAGKSNGVDDQDVAARSAGMSAALSPNSDWWLLGQIAQILIIRGMIDQTVRR